jgi:DNA-directed RNA polymerase specialized sigma subunit
LDLIQVGNNALLVAINTFTLELNTTFSAHAQACVTEAIAKAAAELAK